MDQIPDSPTWISGAAFAKLRGVSKMAVSLAIKDGRLKSSVIMVDGVPKIRSAAEAMEEWDRNTDNIKRINAGGGQEPPRRVQSIDIPRAAERITEARVELESSAPEDIATATERLRAAQADLAELKLAEQRAELVPAADVEREWAGILSTVRGHLLGLPSRLKQSIPSLTLQDVDLITRLVREALEDVVTMEEDR